MATKDEIALQLGRIGRMELECKEAKRKILEAAEHRLGVVNARIEELKGKALTDDEPGAEYQKMIEERSVLHTLLAEKKSAK